jgi:hypothetical protein
MLFKISIILVNFNSKKFLFNCIQSLYESFDKGDDRFEVIIIDNNSSDDSCQMVRQNFPNVGLIENKANLGFGRANNLAVKQAKGDYILLLNPDTVLDGKILDETLNFFQHHSDNKSAFGGMLLNPDGTEQRGGRRSFPTLINAFLHFTKLDKVWQYKKSYDLSWLPIETHPVECVSGACIAMPKPMYEALGGFDEQFFLHFEDIDLCKRIWQAGYQLWFYPQVRVFHTKGGSSTTSESIKIKVNKWFLDSLGKYLWKWDKPSAIIFSPILATLKLVAWFKSLPLTNQESV